MKNYLVIRQAEVADGANNLWKKEIYLAESYSVDDHQQLHLWIGKSHVATFAQGCWTGIEEATVKKDN